MVQTTSASPGALKALTYRISSTPVQELPRVASQIAGAIWNCRQLLSAPGESKRSAEETSAIKQFNTQLTTLLQDRTVEGRWSAVVLTKATIEAGGLEILSKCNPWVRSLLAILKKPYPPTTRSLAVVTLTRIFMLTWNYSNIIREITTPALTAFVPTCLANIENKRCSSSELQTVLEAFITLVPRHPTIFRTHEAKIRSFTASILSPESMNVNFHYTQAHQASARRLAVALHHCAPKQGAVDKWAETIRSAVIATHSTCDRVLRTFQEDWQSVAGIEPSVRSHLMLQGENAELQSRQVDTAGLKPWKGVYAGSERLITLLHVIRAHIEEGTAGSVAMPMGLVTDLLSRLFAATVPRPGKQDFFKLNHEISRDERDALFAALPDVHAAAVEICLALLERFGKQAVSLAQNIVDQALWVFTAESQFDSLRLALYRLFNTTLQSMGASITKEDASELVPVLKSCCKEITPNTGDPSSSASNGAANGLKQQLGLAGTGSSQSIPTDSTPLDNAAEDLLESALIRLDSGCIPPQIRAQIDRTAVLIRSQKLLIASVMNPVTGSRTARGQASLMPILARESAHVPEVEALLRPRMPFIHAGRKKSHQDDELDDDIANGADDESDDSKDDDEEMEDEEKADDVDAGAQNGVAQPSAPSNGKRTATDDSDQSTSAKRFRASPTADSLLSTAGQSSAALDLPAQPPRTTVTETPVSIDISMSETMTTTAVLPIQDLAVAGSSTNAPIDVGDMEDEDASDFEPPLTMDQDTDPEDE